MSRFVCSVVVCSALCLSVVTPTIAQTTKPAHSATERRELQSRLFDAIRKDDSDAIRAAVEAGADVNEKTLTRIPLLSFAAMKEKPDTLKLLLSLGASPNPKNTREHPLTTALNLGRVENANLLLDAGAEVNVLDDRSCTPLFHAALRGNPDLVKRLLKAGATPQDAFTPQPTLFAALSGGNYETFAAIRPLYKDLKFRDREGRTAIHVVCMPGPGQFAPDPKTAPDRIKIIDELIAAGLDPRTPLGEQWEKQMDLRVPMHVALFFSLDDVALHFLKIAKHDQHELNMALRNAAERSGAETLKAILDAGGAIHVVGKDGKLRYGTLLNDVVKRRSVEKLRVLLDAGHPVDLAIAPRQRTALHQAVVHGTAECVALLLERGASRELKDADGLDALALAKVRLEKGREYERRNGVE